MFDFIRSKLNLQSGRPSGNEPSDKLKVDWDKSPALTQKGKEVAKRLLDDRLVIVGGKTAPSFKVERLCNMLGELYLAQENTTTTQEDN